MDYSTQVLLVRLLKFTSVFAYAAGVGVGLWGGDVKLRKRAVHSYASPALLVVWLSGYLLTLQTRVPLTEMWILGGFISSVVAHTILTKVVHLEPAVRSMRLATLLLSALTLVFMVARPTWRSVWP